ncbi:MAG TPA: carboxypeptidase regulatory-like domain-containing protein [Candidatus Acidoferrum sp.]
MFARMKRLLWALAVLWLCLGINNARPVYGQVAGATLTGVISSDSGTPVANAKLSIKNVVTGVVRTSKTDKGGQYTAPNLLPGTYEIAVTAAGDATSIQHDVTLGVGATQTINLTLKSGEVSEKIVISMAPPSVDLSASAISGNVDASTVRDLPLNGRDWTQLATLQADVDTVSVQQPNGVNAPRGNRGYGNQMTISGTRPQQNNYRLDGVSFNDYSNGAPGSVVGVDLGVDAIREFTVLTSNYSAEYGRASGGVINAITRSGGNEFHASLYEFLRNSAFDARNFFDGAAPPPFRRNQFGATLGGPIQKDKTFFFVNYEGLRQGLTNTAVDTVPSQAARNGNLCAPPNCSTTNLVTVDPQAARYLAFWPLPNGGLICPFASCAPGTGDSGIYTTQVPTSTSEDFFTTRIDQKIGDRDSLFGTYVFDRASVLAPDPLDLWVDSNLSRRQIVSVEENHIFTPTYANSVRFGFSRVVATVNSPENGVSPLATDTSFGIFPGQYAPQISVPGLTLETGGLGALPTFLYNWNSFQFYDDAFYTRGNHSLRFGWAMERMLNDTTANLAPTGLYGFGSLSAFLTNQPANLGATIPGSLSPRDIRQTMMAGYVQDDWRVRRNFTVNLGVRYEFTTVPTEVNGKLDNLRSLTAIAPTLGSPYFSNPTYRNFEPRVGFAWDPFHDGKTSVRAAFGVYDVLPLIYEFTLAISETAPFYKIGTSGNLPAGSFPNTAATLIANDPTSLQTGYVQPNPPRNYVMNWNLTLQRQLSRNLTAMIGYVGNRGVHMLNREDDANSVLPTMTPQGLMWPSPAGSGTRLNPNVGAIRALYWGGNSFYDALEAQVIKKLSSGFTIQGGYTWGKAIDTGSASVIGDPFQNSISSPYYFCNSCRRGLSDFNVAQSLTSHFLWELPVPKDWTQGALRSLAFGGWELGGIFTAQSGVPFTAILGGDPLGLNSSDPWAYPNRLAGPGCNSLVNTGNPNNYIKLQCLSFPNPSTLMGNLGRNSLIGPGLMDLDFAVLKNFPIRRISESARVQFRAEMFNILNRANFAPPIANETVFDQSGNVVPGAGAINETTTSSRQIQFGLKLSW